MVILPASRVIACARMFSVRLMGGTLLALALFACAQAPAIQPQPETGSTWTDKPGWQGKKFMVAAANPLATESGYQILKAGGSAMDAAIAVQMVLTLVEPQSSGIGGGAFLLHFDNNTVKTFDGRETAPAESDESLFLTSDGKPMSFAEAVAGGRSIGTPGVLRMLEIAHQQYGRLPWKRLFAPAIELAENGFPISPRLHTLLKKETRLMSDAVALAYFYNADGAPKAIGTILKNPELAITLREIANKGADAFYSGELAHDIVTKVRSHSTNPGRLSEKDLTDYRAKERPPICFEYKRYAICSMPPPSSGAIAIGQILGILEYTDIARHKPMRVDSTWRLSPQAVHLFSEAGRLAYADRAQYVADADFVPVSPALLDKDYLAQRAALIAEQSMGKAAPGTPPGVELEVSADRSAELVSTSHISVVDAQGNAVAMTSSIEDVFGARLWVRGFLLNNQLTDFSFAPTANGKSVANRVQPGKRPRSSMSPTLVFNRDSGQLVMTVGSAGGSAIINYVTKVLIGTLDWHLSLQEAISLPNVGSRNGPTELEKDRTSKELIDALKARGHDVATIEQTSGLQGIMRTRAGWFGAADPRREGVARGD